MNRQLELLDPFLLRYCQSDAQLAGYVESPLTGEMGLEDELLLYFISISSIFAHSFKGIIY